MTQTFDPKSHKKDFGSDDPIPAGTYLLAMRWFERKESKAGSDYLRCRFEVIAGPGKGRSFFSNLSLNLSKPGSSGRLAAYCACVGDESSFDVESDKQLTARFLNQPFKARVSQKPYGDRMQNDLDRYEPDVTSEEASWMDGWAEDLQKHLAARAAAGESMPDDDAPFPQDDDIPFG